MGREIELQSIDSLIEINDTYQALSKCDELLKTSTDDIEIQIECSLRKAFCVLKAITFTNLSDGLDDDGRPTKYKKEQEDMLDTLFEFVYDITQILLTLKDLNKRCALFKEFASRVFIQINENFIKDYDVIIDHAIKNKNVNIVTDYNQGRACLVTLMLYAMYNVIEKLNEQDDVNDYDYDDHYSEYSLLIKNKNFEAGKLVGNMIVEQNDDFPYFYVTDDIGVVGLYPIASYFFAVSDDDEINAEERIYRLKHSVATLSDILNAVFVTSDEKRVVKGSCVTGNDRNEIYQDIMEMVKIIRKYEPSYQPPQVNLNEQKSGGCYVATAVYGSYDCPEVWTLRRYRDFKLAKTWHGRTFIRIYYAVSPTLVKLFGHTKWFKELWKVKLDRMVSELQAEGFESTPYND